MVEGSEAFKRLRTAMKTILSVRKSDVVPDPNQKTRKAQKSQRSRRFPRPCLSDSFLVNFRLTRCPPCKLVIGQPPTDSLRHCNRESVKVFDLCIAVVEPESLLVKIPEKVKGFNGNVCPVQAPFQQGPVVLHPFVWTFPLAYSTAWLMTWWA